MVFFCLLGEGQRDQNASLSLLYACLTRIPVGLEGSRAETTAGYT